MMEGNIQLEIRQGAFRYHDGPVIFEDVSFSLRAGQVFCILGPNGAGKSTLLNCLANLFPLQKGEILLNGQPMHTLSRREVAQWIGYVPQSQDPTYGYTVRDFVVMGRAPYISTMQLPKQEDFEKADQALEIMGIEHLRDRPYTDISGGERQQATIARVIAQEPKIILMDEPTSSLDFGNQLRTIRMIRSLAQRGYAVVMTTHNPDHAIMLDDTVGVLDREGRMTAGLARQVLTEQLLSSVYRVDVKIVHVDAVDRDACLTKME